MLKDHVLNLHGQVYKWKRRATLIGGWASQALEQASGLSMEPEEAYRIGFKQYIFQHGDFSIEPNALFAEASAVLYPDA